MSYISIIIPPHNSAHCIKSYINNSKKQSLHNIEIICIDNASTYSTLATLHDIATFDRRVIATSVPENKGQGNAYNKGMKKAIAKYVCFFDGIATVDETCFADLYDRITEHNIDIPSYIQQILGTWLTSSPIHFEKDYIVQTTIKKISAMYANCSTFMSKYICKKRFLVENTITFPIDIYQKNQYSMAHTFLQAKYIFCENNTSPKYYYHLHKYSSMHSKYNNYPKKILLDQTTLFAKIENVSLMQGNSSIFTAIMYQSSVEIILSYVQNIHILSLQKWIQHCKKTFSKKIFLKSSIIRNLWHLHIVCIVNIDKTIKKIQNKYSKIKTVFSCWRKYS
ncbi:MAG: glycosyltransferase family 2 protein [Desulfovibrionaceae bacterium]